MLVLSRYKDEEILIGEGPDQIRIMIVDAIGKVRVGIDAPREVRVDRREIAERKKKWPGQNQ